LLANPALKPGSTEIQWMAEYFRELLRIRKSSLLFRLRTEEQVKECLSFLNTGPEQIPGLIVMCLKSPLVEGSEGEAMVPSAESGKAPTAGKEVSHELVESAKTRPVKLVVPPWLKDSSPTLPRGVKGLTAYTQIVVFFNAAPGQITFTEASLVGKEINLHPIQAASVDDKVRAAHYDKESGVFTVPERTTAVFVLDDDKTRPVQV